jgi:RES domain-containing protein
MNITAWRIITAQHAGRAFDGEGARLADGRWNKIGIPMIQPKPSAPSGP